MLLEIKITDNGIEEGGIDFVFIALIVVVSAGLEYLDPLSAESEFLSVCRHFCQYHPAVAGGFLKTKSPLVSLTNGLREPLWDFQIRNPKSEIFLPGSFEERGVRFESLARVRCYRNCVLILSQSRIAWELVFDHSSLPGSGVAARPPGALNSDAALQVSTDLEEQLSTKFAADLFHCRPTRFRPLQFLFNLENIDLFAARLVK